MREIRMSGSTRGQGQPWPTLLPLLIQELRIRGFHACGMPIEYESASLDRAGARKSDR
jgi:hypothetical protein